MNTRNETCFTCWLTGVFDGFKLRFVGVEVSWRERRQGSALHPPKGTFREKFPLDTFKSFHTMGMRRGVYLALAVKWFGRGDYKWADGCLPYMVRAGKLRSRQGPPRPCRFGCRGARRTKWGHLVYETRLLCSILSENFTDKATTVQTEQ